jgi:patatin-like phospholipase/acyl hydrolase
MLLLFFINFSGNGCSSTSDHDHQGLTTILSIDGGGVRGIIPSIVLAALEAKLQVIESKTSALPSCYF